MFEFHNLGALAIGAVLIGGFQMGSQSDAGRVFDGNPAGAKFVSAGQGRRDLGPRMRATEGLDAFATDETENDSQETPGVLVHALATLDKIGAQAKDVGRDVLGAFTE